MNNTAYATATARQLPAFATPDPIAVSIELSVGDVRVVASDRADTVVQISPSDPSRDADVRDAGLTRVERTPVGLLIRAPRPRGLGLLGKPGSVDVTIELPAGSSLHGDSSVAAFRSAILRSIQGPTPTYAPGRRRVLLTPLQPPPHPPH